MMIKKITFEIETITPMFLSGADQSKAELRAASIKGLLRFWWRALQAEPDLESLRRKESKIFGSADEKTGGGSFSIRILFKEKPRVSTTFPDTNDHKIMVTSRRQNRTFPINIFEYLAYGPYDPQQRRLKREYLQPSTNFDLLLSFPDDKFIEQILESLFVFNLFGGIGSRCRNGFGSLNIKNISDVFSPISSKYSLNEPYAKANLQKLIKKVTTISYSSFTSETKVFRTTESHNSWDKALSEVGKIYRGIRVGEKKFNNKALEDKHSFKKREYIGAPLDPYQENFHSLLDRHAKPYFIKVTKEGTRYRSYILYLPSLYCYGLDEDRNKRKITNHAQLDKNFAEICNEFNNFLAQYMEPVI